MLATTVLNRRYRLDQLRYAGPDGVELYLATDMVTHEQVDVAAATADSQGADRLVREQHILQGIRHPSIVQIYDFGLTIDQTRYIVHEHLRGKSLAGLIRESGPLPAERLVGIIDQLASAIDAAHAHDILHGVIRPEHVVIYPDQLGIERCKLAGFSYAIKSEDALLNPPVDPALHPAPAFMSPEQLNRLPLDKSSDVYSLAAIVYFAWTGKPPFEGATPEQITTNMEKGPPPKVSERSRHLQLPAKVDAVIAAALDPRQDRRPTTAMALADAIRGCFSVLPCGTEGLVAAAQGESPSSRIRTRTSAPTAVVRPAGKRLQPASEGDRAFAGVTTEVIPGVDVDGTRAYPFAGIAPAKFNGPTFAEIRLVVFSVLLVGGLLWLSFQIG